MARVDHVIIATREPEVAARSLFAQFGLGHYAAGRVQGIGTESYIVPLDGSYLELVGIVDEREAKTNPLGRAVLKGATGGAKFLTWALEPGESVQPTATRLDMPANPMKRALPDGGDVTCTICGLQRALEEPPLPYFVEWANREERPDLVEVDDECDPKGFAWIEVAGDQQRYNNWVADASVPVQWVDGEAGIQAVSILTTADPIILRVPLDLKSMPERQPKESLEGTANSGEQPSVYESVLESVEHAVESAAEVVEGVAGQILSPRSQHET